MYYRRILLLVTVAIMILLSACGTRGLPAIRQDTLDNKLSVLMVTSPKLSDSVKQTIGTKLLEWRGANQIAFEWIKDKSAIDESVRLSIQSKSYDYIYVIGNELFPTAIQASTQDIKKKWTLIQDQLDMQPQLPGTQNLAYLQIDPKQVDDLKTYWVNQLLAQKVSIEWVTMAENPIPSAWAPSEEADHIVLLNNNGDWFNQLNHQTRQHASKWILFNTSVDPSFLQKAKTIGVSVVDLSSTLEVNLAWDAILANRLAAMTSHQWQNGFQSFNAQEMMELKIK
jgi:hypothetical protein